MTFPAQNNQTVPANRWVEGELRLAGMLDSRLLGLLRAIERTGSINQAAKQANLSYKGAWQIIERANNVSPKILITTATGGAKGGGTCLTDAGKALLNLFSCLEQQHQQFLDQLNASLAQDPDTLLLLQRLIVKTSAHNELFGTINLIQAGAVNAKINVKLKGEAQIWVTVSLSAITALDLKLGSEAILIINQSDITLTTMNDYQRFPADNILPCRVLRSIQDEINAEVKVVLPGGEILAILTSPQSLTDMVIVPGQSVWAIFSSNAPILGVKS